MAERLPGHHAEPQPRLSVLAIVLAGQRRLAGPLQHGAEKLTGTREVACYQQPMTGIGTGGLGAGAWS
jgi:hypothetical protein